MTIQIGVSATPSSSRITTSSEYVAGIHGKAGNLKGKVVPAATLSRGRAAREYPLPPLTPSLACELFDKASRNGGYHPFPRPTANASRPIPIRTARSSAPASTAVLRALRLRGQRQGQPHMTVIPIAMRNPNFELRTQHVG